jgi:hypothetical protein
MGRVHSLAGFPGQKLLETFHLADQPLNHMGLFAAFL